MSYTTAFFLSLVISVIGGGILGVALGPISTALTITACISYGAFCGFYLPGKLVKVTAPRK